MDILYLTDIDLEEVVDLFAKKHPRRLERIAQLPKKIRKPIVNNTDS